VWFDKLRITVIDKNPCRDYFLLDKDFDEDVLVLVDFDFFFGESFELDVSKLGSYQSF